MGDLHNPFLASVPILYPLKISENQIFSGVFRGYRIRTFARNGLSVDDKYICEVITTKMFERPVYLLKSWEFVYLSWSKVNHCGITNLFIFVNKYFHKTSKWMAFSNKFSAK